MDRGVVLALQTAAVGNATAVWIVWWAAEQMISGRSPTANARGVDTPSRERIRASCTPTGASDAMVTTNLFGTVCPSAATTGFAVIFGVEKRSSRASSMC